MQLRTMREYAKRRDWSIVVEIRDIASGTSVRPRREELIHSARRRELDVILVWRLDRWGRSLLDLIGSLQELNELGVGFVSAARALWPACSRSSPSSSATFCATGSRPGLHKPATRDGLTDDPSPSAATPTTTASSSRKASA